MVPVHYTNAHPSRVMSTVLACFQPIFIQEVYSCALSDGHMLEIQCQKWGDIGEDKLS